LKNVDEIIYPIIHEPFGLVAIEALAIRTPLLCNMRSGLSDFIDETVCIPYGIT
jgi:glycosyltransferase involved in cell wall biosynthesis